MRLYDDDGNRKPLIQLMFELLYLVVTNEEYIYITGKEATENEKVYWGTNKQLQASYDAIHYADEQGIRTPSELQARIQAVGTELSEVRQGLAYYSRREDEFAQRKRKNLAEQEERLKRDYRQLKYIESQKSQMEHEIERYIRSGKSLDDLLAYAKSQAGQKKNARGYER